MSFFFFQSFPTCAFLSSTAEFCFRMSLLRTSLCKLSRPVTHSILRLSSNTYFVYRSYPNFSEPPYINIACHSLCHAFKIKLALWGLSHIQLHLRSKVQSALSRSSTFYENFLTPFKSSTEISIREMYSSVGFIN